MLYRYLKATAKNPSPGKIIPRYLKIMPTIMSAVGLGIVASVAWPMLNYQVFSIFNKGNDTQFLSPAIYESFANDNLHAEINKPEVLADIDYTKASNWFSFSPLEAALTPRSTATNISQASSGFIDLDEPTNFQDRQVVQPEYTLAIPSLNIKTANVKVNADDLTKSLIQYHETALPGGFGSPVVFGHSTLPQLFSPTNYLSIFSTLPTIKLGSDILITYADVQYTYRVSRLYEVKPTDIWVLRQDYSQKSLKLITCVPPGTKLLRLVVEADLVKS